MLHTRAGREAAPARDPAARRRENPRMHTPTDQSRQSRRAKAAKWDEAEFRWRAGMTFKISSLRAFLATLPCQILHLFLINLEPVGLFHVLAQVRNEQPEQIVLFGFKERLPDPIFLRDEFLIRRYLLFQKLTDHAIAAGGGRPADIAWLQCEDRARASHRSDVRDLAIGRNQVARLHGRTQILGSFLQIVRRLGA